MNECLNPTPPFIKMYLHIVYHTLCYSFSKEIFKTCAEWRFLKKIGRSLKTLEFLGCKTFIFLYTSYYIQENKYEFEREYAQTNWQFRHTHYLWIFSTKVIYWSKIIFNLFHQSIYHPQNSPRYNLSQNIYPMWW